MNLLKKHIRYFKLKSREEMKKIKEKILTKHKNLQDSNK